MDSAPSLVQLRAFFTQASMAAALVWSGVASATAQDVIYSQAGPGGYSRYEQYGYGQNAVVRYQGTETTPYAQGVTVQSTGNLQRVGPGPQFGTFAGTRVTSGGPTPGALYRSLGPGLQTQGQMQYSATGQPYYQQTPNGPVLVQPQPYFVRQPAAGTQVQRIPAIQGQSPRVTQPRQTGQAPISRAPIQIQQPTVVTPGQQARPAGISIPGQVQVIRPAPAGLVPAPPAALPPP